MKEVKGHLTVVIVVNSLLEIIPKKKPGAFFERFLQPAVILMNGVVNHPAPGAQQS